MKRTPAIAKSRACLIEGCGKAVLTKGWCRAHYRRFLRYGDPLSGGTRRGEPLAFLEDVAVNFDGDECLIWPFSTRGKGYGRIKIDGETHDVHRVVCEREHGPAPTPKHQAAHSCGKGHEGCINRRHLRWATQVENEADKLTHGTDIRGERHRAAKLTESQVLEIRASTRLHRELAEKYGISRSAVSGIKSRKKWAWLEQAA